MTIWTAIIGLAGVLGGATIGAVAEIFGPSRLHKRQAQALRNEAEIQRLVALRTTGREWLDALERVAGDIDAGRVIDLNKFDASVGPLRDLAVRSIYDLAVDGRSVASIPGPGRLIRRRPSGTEDLTPEGPQNAAADDVLTEARRHESMEAYSDVMASLRRAHDAVRHDLRNATLDKSSTGVAEATWQLLDAAGRARAVLNVSLLAHIETITAPT